MTASLFTRNVVRDLLGTADGAAVAWAHMFATYLAARTRWMRSAAARTPETQSLG